MHFVPSTNFESHEFSHAYFSHSLVYFRKFPNIFSAMVLLADMDPLKSCQTDISHFLHPYVSVYGSMCATFLSIYINVVRLYMCAIGSWHWPVLPHSQ